MCLSICSLQEEVDYYRRGFFLFFFLVTKYKGKENVARMNKKNKVARNEIGVEGIKKTGGQTGGGRNKRREENKRNKRKRQDGENVRRKK